MTSRLPIVGVVCLLVLGAGGAVYIYRDVWSGPGLLAPTAESGITIESPPAALPAVKAEAVATAMPTKENGAPPASGNVKPPAPVEAKPPPAEIPAKSAKGEAVEATPPVSSPPGPIVVTSAPPTPPAESVAKAKPSAPVAAKPRPAAPPASSPSSPIVVASEPPAIAPPNSPPSAIVVTSPPPTPPAQTLAKAEPPVSVEAKPPPVAAPAPSPPSAIVVGPPLPTPPAEETAKVAPPSSVEARSPPVAESTAKEAASLPLVEAKPVLAPPPVAPPAAPIVEPPAAPVATPLAAPAADAARDETPPPEPKPALAMAPPPAGSLSSPIAEAPPAATLQTVAPPASPAAESAAKKDPTPPAPVETKTSAAETLPPAPLSPAPLVESPPPALPQSASPPTRPAVDSTLQAAAPPAPAEATPASSDKPPIGSPAASPAAKPAAEGLAKNEAAPSAEVAQSPAPAPAPVEPQANSQTEIIVKSAPAPAPQPDAKAAKPTTPKGAGAGEGQLAAIIPPRAPQAMLAIDDATVGKDYAADLPPFSDSNGASGIALHVEPAPPEGLSFADLGSGFGAISGKPTKPGRYVFDVVATNSGGGATRMTTKINVAPAPLEPKPQPQLLKSDANPQVAALEPIDKAARFLSGFDGGPCFLARVAAAGDSTAAGGAAAHGAIAIEGVGSQKQVFERFYESFIRDVGVEPMFVVRLIAPPQCPAINLIAAHGDRAAPTIKLAAYDVPRGKPLAGSIGALAGRSLDVLMISNDGLAYKIVSRALAGDQSAPFSVPITPDAGSLGALQILVAIASPKPLDALAAFRSGPSAEILPKVAAQLASADAALGVEYFRFLK